MRRAMAMLTAAVLVAGACSGDDDADGEAVTTSSTTEEVDDTSAETSEAVFRAVVSDDGNAMVIVPTDETRDITVDILDPADYPEFLAGAQQSEGTVVYDLGPDGATFDEPVRFFRRVEVGNVDPDGSLDLFDVPLLLTYTTDDDGQPVLAESPSLLRAGSSVWIGSSFDHFSPAITISTQRTVDSTRVLAPAITGDDIDDLGAESVRARQLPSVDGALAINWLGEGSEDGLPSHAAQLGADIPVFSTIEGPPDLDDIEPIDLDLPSGDEIGLSAIATDFRYRPVFTWWEDRGQDDELPPPGGFFAGFDLELSDLPVPFGDPVTTTVSVGAFMSTEEAERVLDEYLDRIDRGLPGQQPAEPSPSDGAIVGGAISAAVDVRHFDFDSELGFDLFFTRAPDAPEDFFLVSVFGDPSAGPVPAPGVAQLRATPEGATADVRIDRYGDWNAALVYAPDGDLDPGRPIEIVTDGGTDFLVVDGVRTELPTTILRTEPGGPKATFSVDASEGRIFEAQVFADGFESGDTSAWTTAN